MEYNMLRYYIIFFLISCSGIAQHQDKVDFIKGQISIRPLPDVKSIKGTVRYEFVVLSDLDSIFLDAKNMHFTWIKLDGKTALYAYDGLRAFIKNSFKKGEKHILELNYECTPKQTVYFLGWGNDVENHNQTMSAGRQVWTQGQGKYTSHWLPSFDDMEEKVEFDLSITFDKNYECIVNGKLKEKIINLNTATWKYDMQKPMSSYLLAFIIGDYSKQELVSGTGIPIENYYYSHDSLKVEPTYRHTKQIFDFLEEEIGVPYPWQNYKQIPVRDFLYAGMENTTATIFSDSFMIDSTSFVDKNYVNVNAHELAHQWFGNLVTEKDGNHHWLHEGFATYYAYLAEQEIFGEDHLYWKLYDSAKQLKELSDRGEGESLLNPKASSLTFYEKGAWALVMLRELVGDEAFKNGIENYLLKYQFKNVTIDDFLDEIESASGLDLTTFKLLWLESKELPFENIKMVLRESCESLDLLFIMENRFLRTKSDDVDYEDYWNKTKVVQFRKALIENHHRILPETIILNAFALDTVPIRQALANSLYGISGARRSPKGLKSLYETLLDDESYITNEIALIKLWSNFPENRNQYLDSTKNIIGLPNNNVRLLWLALALVTADYNISEKTRYLDELIGYTGAAYNPEIRQTAFQYGSQIKAENHDFFVNLIKATNHHSWQFRNFTRKMLDIKLDDLESKNRIVAIAKQLKPSDLRYLKTKIELP